MQMGWIIYEALPCKGSSGVWSTREVTAVLLPLNSEVCRGASVADVHEVSDYAWLDFISSLGLRLHPVSDCTGVSW